MQILAKLSSVPLTYYIQGLKVDSQKVESIETWERPKTIFKVRSFFGFARYYRRFMEGFSKLVLPLKTLTKKATKFKWKHECKKSFQELKCKLTTVFFLHLLFLLFSFVPDYQDRLNITLILYKRLLTWSTRSFSTINMMVKI